MRTLGWFPCPRVVLKGIGQLFPWNVFINAEDYFRRRLCGSSFEDSFEDCFSVGYNVAATVGLLFALWSVSFYHGLLTFEDVLALMVSKETCLYGTHLRR